MAPTIDVQLAKMSSDAKKEGFDFDDGSDIDPGEFVNEVSLEELEGAIEDPDPFNDEEQLWS